jgi:hypothetical protein
MLVSNVTIIFKGDNPTMKTSQGRIFTNDGECYDDVDLPDDFYDRERMFF